MNRYNDNSDREFIKLTIFAVFAIIIVTVFIGFLADLYGASV